MTEPTDLRAQIVADLETAKEALAAQLDKTAELIDEARIGVAFSHATSGTLGDPVESLKIAAGGAMLGVNATQALVALISATGRIVVALDRLSQRIEAIEQAGRVDPPQDPVD